MANTVEKYNPEYPLSDNDLNRYSRAARYNGIIAPLSLPVQYLTHVALLLQLAMALLLLIN